MSVKREDVRKVLDTDFQTFSTTGVGITDLTMSLRAAKYKFTFLLNFNFANISGSQFGLSLGGTATLTSGVWYFAGSNSVANTASVLTTAPPLFISGSTPASPRVALVEGEIDVASAGDLLIYAKTSSASVALNVINGSYVEYSAL